MSSNSDYSSDNQNDEFDQDSQKSNFKVFQQDFYLSASLPLIQIWKQNISKAINQNNSIDPIKYLQIQQSIFDKQQNFILSTYHIRYFAFAFYLQKALQIVKHKYTIYYETLPFKMKNIKQLDQLLIKLTFYLQKIQLTRAINYINQIDEEVLNRAFSHLKIIFPMIINPYCLWRVIMYLQMVNQDQKQNYVMNIPINMKMQYYLKTFKTLKFKSQKLTKISFNITKELQKQNYLQAYLIALKQINKIQISDQIRCQFLTCLRYMYYLKNDQFKLQKNLHNEYIISSLKIPYYGRNQNMPIQYYENLFIKILNQSQNNPQLLNLSLYIDPNAVKERTKQNFGKIQEIVLKLVKEVLKAQQEYLQNKKYPSKQHIIKLLKPQEFTLLIQFMQTIMQFNKAAFLKADNQIYDIFLQMAQLLKNLFLSFGKELWLFPQNIFTPLTLDFFKKISEDINTQLKNILYQMIVNLNQDKMPSKLVFQNNQFIVQKVTRLQYLSAILYYIDDCSRQQQYLNLPQIVPSNLETSILLIKSFHVRLKHHEPNPAQLPLFTEYLKQCQKYKLNIKFPWFKQTTNKYERQIQFQIQTQIKQKQIQTILRKCLNFRDREYARKLIQESHNKDHQINAVQVASRLKYNHGMIINSEIQNIRQEQIFMIIEQMQTMLAIIPNNLFDLKLEEQISVNYLHLLLIFYRSKIKQAKGSDIYQQILNKILLNYLKVPSQKSKKFKQKYPAFFQKYIFQYHQLQICKTLIDLILQVSEKVDFQKQINEWTQIQKKLINDLKQKIQLIRDQFIQKLQGSQQQITFFMLSFTSIISQNMPFQIFLECSRLFIKIVQNNAFLLQITSLDFFLNVNIYKKPNFFPDIVKYFEDFATESSKQKLQIKITILRHILGSVQILQIISCKYLITFLHLFDKIQQQQEKTQKHLVNLFNEMNKKINNGIEQIGNNWILTYIILFFQQYQDNPVFGKFNNQNTQESIQEIKIKFKNLQQILIKLKNKPLFWQKVKQQIKQINLSQSNFVFVFIDHAINLKNGNNLKHGIIKQVWIELIKCLNDPSWTFYYMIKFNEPNLISIHQNRDQMLLYLIKKQKLTKQSYEIFKNMISETKNMDEIIKKIMINYEQEQNYTQNYQFHNKLILINQRFPNNFIEQKILKWIQNGQNKLPLKIPQTYYINYIKKELKSISDKVGEEWLFKIHKDPSQLISLSQKIQKTFDLLLYFPIRKIKNIVLTNLFKELQVNQQQENQDQWQQNSQDQQQQKQTKDEKKNNKQNSLQLSNKSQQNYSQHQNDQQYASQSSEGNQQDQDQDNNYDNEDKPPIIDMFLEKSQQFQKYKTICKIRQQIDVYLQSNYKKILQEKYKNDFYLKQKILNLQKQLQNMDEQYQKSIILYMPQNLYDKLKQFGYKLQKDTQKLKKLRKPKQKIFQIQNQTIFSDRAQSDDQNSQYDQESNDQSWSEEEDSSNQDLSNSDKENQIKKQSNDKQQEYQLPPLTSQFTKIQEQIKGNQIEKKELSKILQIFIIQIFRLTPINFKKKQIIFSYMDIMQSQYKQIFFDSILTLLRIQQNPQKNKKTFIKQYQENFLQQKNKFKVQQILGICDFSKYNGITNFVHLLRLMYERNHFDYQQKNPFLKQCGSLLPITEKFIIQFDLPIQSNLFTLIFLYIKSSSRIKQGLQNSQFGFTQNPVKLTKKQIKRISQAFLNQKTHYSSWRFIEQTLNYQVSDVDRLIISLDIYSKGVLKSLSTSALRIKQAFDKNKPKQQNIINIIQKDKEQKLNLDQRNFYIASNLLDSCSQQIKRFYFMNKTICHYLWQDDDQNNDNYNYQKVPKKLKTSKQLIFENDNFKLLLELSIRIIYYLKDQLYGKLSPKKFKRLIKYPKLIIQTATIYMYISSINKQVWNFTDIKTVKTFISNFKMGQYKFKNIIQVYNLILGLLELQSFCQFKFKRLLIPYFTQNINRGLEAPLMFKVPKIDDNIQGQNILVTRQCSFDMAFYQVQGSALIVQFHGEEGSDHGGIIRQFMMGWKGSGIGQENFFIGKILGISFNQTVPYGGNIDIQMCIRITNYQITLERLESIDKQIYESLKFINGNDPSELGLTFSILKKNIKSFQLQQFQLKPGGNKIQLNNQNKKQYIELYLQKYFKVGRQDQLDQIATGFYTVVNKIYVSIFKPHELMQHLKGQQVCDINFLKSHTKYEQGYSQASTIVKWFWQILQSFNQEHLNKFIQFLTGSPKLPIFNPDFSIILQRIFDIQKLPVAHTCFNTLDLPQYSTKQILQKKLLTAIFEGNQTFSIM